MIGPWPPASPVLLPETLLFALMMAGNLYVFGRLFPRNASLPTLADLTFVVGLLVMALGLWSSLVYAVVDPGAASEVSVFIALNSMMAVVGCWMLALFLRAERRQPAAAGWRWPLLLALLIVGNEVLMGLAFVLLQSGAGIFTSGGSLGVVPASAAAATSAWFFAAMFIDLVAIVLWLPLPRANRWLLGIFALSALPGPWVITAPPLGLIATGALMALSVVAFFLARRRGPLDLPYLRTFALVVAGFALMTASEGAYVVSSGSAAGQLLLGVGTVAAMTAVLTFVSRWSWRSDARQAPEVGIGSASPRIDVPRPAAKGNP